MTSTNSAVPLKTTRKKANMATNPQSINTVPNPETVTKKIKVFSAETLAPVESTYSYTFQDAATMEEADARIAAIQSELAAKRLLLAKNGVLNFFAAREARANVSADGIPRKALLKAISGLRAVDPFASMITAAPKTSEYREQRKAQTEALLEMLRQPSMSALKTMIIAGITPGDDDDENEGDSDDE